MASFGTSHLNALLNDLIYPTLMLDTDTCTVMTQLWVQLAMDWGTDFIEYPGKDVCFSAKQILQSKKRQCSSRSEQLDSGGLTGCLSGYCCCRTSVVSQPLLSQKQLAEKQKNAMIESFCLVRQQIQILEGTYSETLFMEDKKYQLLILPISFWVTHLKILAWQHFFMGKFLVWLEMTGKETL